MRKTAMAPMEAKLRELRKAVASGDSARCETLAQELWEMIANSHGDARKRLSDIKILISLFDFEKTLKRIDEAISLI